MRLCVKAFLFLALLSTVTLCGIRGPGKYAGIVIFDQWDTCYLYSGVYLMYISAKKKELLRPFRGKSILINAKEVIQPINPGDGLITKFKFLGFAKAKRNLPAIRGLKLSATPVFDDSEKAKFRLEVVNTGSTVIDVSTKDISPTLFGLKDPNDVLSPSDGISQAVITRWSFESIKELKTNNQSESTDDQDPVESYLVAIEDPDFLKQSYLLGPNAKLDFVLTLKLPKGTYDLLFGYGGGVHEGKGVASNVVSFDVDERGHSSLLNSFSINILPISKRGI